MILQHIPRRLALAKRYRKPVPGFMLPWKRFRIYDLLQNRFSPSFLITKQVGLVIISSDTLIISVYSIKSLADNS